MSTQIPVNGGILWFGLASTIPTGYERYTAADGVMLRGASSGNDPGDSAGSSTHSHAINAHSHYDNHTHPMVISGSSSGTVTDRLSGIKGEMQIDGHIHSDGVTEQPFSDVLVDSGSLAPTSTSDHTPSAITCILITPSSSPEDVPIDGIFFRKRAEDNFYICDGSNGTADLDDKYFSIAGTGADGNGTTGGVAHFHNALTHTHADTDHFHDDSLFGETRDFAAQISSGSYNGQVSLHHEATSISSETTSWSDASPNVENTFNEVLHKKLVAVQLKSLVSAKLPHLSIIPYMGDIVDIPDDFYLCDGTNGTEDMRDYFVKITATSKLHGTVGGSNTHNHVSYPHTHKANASHTHTYSFTSRITANYSQSGGSVVRASEGHTHTSHSLTAVTQDSTASAITFADADNVPKYYTVLFIQYIDPNYPTVWIKGGEVRGGVIGSL